MSPRAGVIGWPVGHSLSPRIHRYWLAEYNVAGRYEAVVVPPDWLADTVDGFRKAHWVGFNVTVPHKEAILPLLDMVDPMAGAIGAVNTVVAIGEDRFEGRNTDASGFLASLRAQCLIPADRPAVILGAGGAARAIAVALRGIGIGEIRIANRSRERADKLAAEFSLVACDWEDRDDVLEGAGLLVNATSLGMTGQPPLEIGLEHLPLEAIVTDIVYRPLDTDLLKKARNRGNIAVDGLGMLLHQAVEGFAAWFGLTPEVTPGLRSHVLAAIAHGS